MRMLFTTTTRRDGDWSAPRRSGDPPSRWTTATEAEEQPVDRDDREEQEEETQGGGQGKHEQLEPRQRRAVFRAGTPKAVATPMGLA